MATTSSYEALPQTSATGAFRPLFKFWRPICVLLAIFAVFLVDALMRPRAFFDLSLMKQIQEVDIPRTYEVTQFINRDLTSSTPAVMSWLVLMLVLAAARWWSAFLTASLMPAGGIVNEIFSRLIVTRTRPHLDELVRTSVDVEERSFPSGHVVGAVMLYGLIFVLLRRIPWRVMRVPLQAVCIGIIVLVGFGRVWAGAHWPSDVISAYPLGFALLLALVAIHSWLEDGGLTILRERAKLLARR
jgi:undecaprenyl-diphosphatase